MSDDAKGSMIVKANKLVQAKMPLTKLEHRIVALLISQLDKDDEEFGYQKLHIKDLQEVSGKGAPGSLYKRAENICSSLLSKKLEIRKKKDGKRVYDGISLMNRCKYKEGDGYIEAKFNEEMKPYLLQLKKRFTMYEAGYYVPLSSTHSMRIYELLKMREGVSILRITVEELRQTLGLEDSYQYFSELEHHVIEKAQKEIKEKTDIHFTYDKEKEGRSVERLKFFIHTPDGSGKPKIEDRTDASDIDVINLFLSELTQEEIDRIEQETLDQLHESAVQYAKKNNPNASRSMIQSVAFRRMMEIWKQ